MLKSADTAPHDGSTFWAYWLDKDPPRRFVKWNDKADPGMKDPDGNVVAPPLAVGWITQDSDDVMDIDSFSFWGPPNFLLDYRNPLPNSNAFVPSLDQAVLARLSYKLQEVGYAGSYIFECLIPEGGPVDIERTLDKIVGYITGASHLPKLDPAKPWERLEQ
jgi:hypothetical protein